MTSNCECHTGRRLLALYHPPAHPALPMFIDVATRLGWTPHPGRLAVLVPVGEQERFSGLGSVSGFLHTEFPDLFSELRSAWLDPRKEPTEQLARGASEPLAENDTVARDGDLLALLRERRIETWYQPVFSVTGGDLWGYECLMRGRAADGSLIMPGRLLDWAREENLLFMLDRVCREAHVENAAAASLPADSYLLINFLPTVIYEPSVCLQTTFRAVRKVGLDPGRIVFEVVETEQVRDHAHLRRILDHYRSAGFNVALDDLGSGHAGLTLLADLEPDLIKLDRDLVTRAVSSRIHRHVCESVIDLGHKEGKLVLAEGVENALEWSVVRDLGADLVQGFFFGRPALDPAREPLQPLA